MCPSFQTSVFIAAIWESFVKLVFAEHDTCHSAVESHPKACLLYCFLDISRSAPRANSLLLSGSLSFNFFAEQHTFALRRTITGRHYVSAIAAVMQTWCHLKTKACPNCSYMVQYTPHSVHSPAPWWSRIAPRKGSAHWGKRYITGPNPSRTYFSDFCILGLWIYNVKTGKNILFRNTLSRKKNTLAPWEFLWNHIFWS